MVRRTTFADRLTELRPEIDCESGPLNLPAWSERHRYFDGEPMRIPGPLREVYASDASKLVVMKGAQLGFSEWAINLTLWTADTGRAGRGNVLYLLPGGQRVGDFVQARVNPAIERSDHLRSRIRPDGDTKDPDKVGLRRIGRDGYTYWRSSGAEPGLRTVDADAVVLDEFDEMASTVLPLVQHRLDSSRSPQLRILSTPTYPGRGIELQYLDGDRRRYLIACGRCGAEQPLEWEKNVAVRGDPHDASCEAIRVCVECGDGIEEAVERAWETGESGRWVAQQPGRAFPSYQLSRLYRPDTDLVAIARDLQSSNADIVQQAWNQHLALPHALAGGQLSLEELRRLCIEPRRMAELAGVQSAGAAPIDVGGRGRVLDEETSAGLGEIWGLNDSPSREPGSLH